jgi:hypothetical protein
VRRWGNAFVAVGVLLAPLAARANGAFPDSENILTPADRPQDILLVTNFGLVASSDGGQTWLWSCEQDGNALGAFYQLTPVPRNRLFAVANQKLAYSDDRSCGWQIGGGAVVGQSITDAFLDPVSGTRVLAIAVSNQIYSLYQSTDTGATFAPAIYQAAAGQTMTGVEIARSDGSIYLALHASGGAPLLARSTDGGAHFDVHDLSTDLGPGLLRIIAVDAQDANRVLLLFLGANDQSIALTVDGGASATKPVTVNGNFNSFVRLPSGTILIGGLVEFSTVPGLFRSRDGGTSFEQVANPPAIRALWQRNGMVYAAADNFGDGYAIGTSADEGTTWHGLMAYADVKAINPCLKTYCQDLCAMEVGLSLWPDAVCAADPPTATGTAGSGGTAGRGGTGGTGGAAGGGATGGTGGRPPSNGGGCDVGAAAAAEPGGLSFLLLLVLGRRRRAARSRS